MIRTRTPTVSREQLRIHNTQLDNLVGNLRGEVGEVITSWTLLAHVNAQARERRPADLEVELRDRSLATLRILSGKLHDEIVARLSELAERKVGQLTFYFASRKLGKFDAEVDAFARFIRSRGFEEKRNLDISHKALPGTWAERRLRYIPYPTLVRGVALASRLMKRIDREVLGPASPYLWAEVRRRRYEPMTPPSVGYLLLPHMRLSGSVRARVVAEEQAAGRQMWESVPTVVDGAATTVWVCKKWGAVLLGSHLLMLEDYPLQHLQHIETAATPSRPGPADATPTPPGGHDGRGGAG